MNRHGRLAACMVALIILIPAAIPAAYGSPATDEAQALVAKGDLEGALTRLDKQLSGAPHDAEARFARGLVLMKLGRTEEALKVYSALTRDYPQLPEPYNNLAVIYAQTGQYDKAREALEAALATHPSYSTAHENLGDIYAALAGAAYSRALALNQTNVTARTKLALVNQLSQPPQTSPAPAVLAAPAPPEVPVDASINSAVIGALNEWAASWSALAIDRYLANYAPDFTPEDGASRAEWAAQRRDRISKAKEIKVTASTPEVSVQAADRASVSFVQTYESDRYADHVNKILDLRNVGGRWLIMREYVR